MREYVTMPYNTYRYRRELTVDSVLPCHTVGSRQGRYVPTCTAACADTARYCTYSKEVPYRIVRYSSKGTVVPTLHSTLPYLT